MMQPNLPFARTRVERLADYFAAQPGVWINGLELARIAGAYAWRTRVSDLRKRGWVIENRQRKQGDYTVSEYRYVPREVAA